LFNEKQAVTCIKPHPAAHGSAPPPVNYDNMIPTLLTIHPESWTYHNDRNRFPYYCNGIKHHNHNNL